MQSTHTPSLNEHIFQVEASLSETIASLRSQVSQQEGSLQGELEAARCEAAAAKESLAATQQRLEDAVQEHENDRQELARLVAKRKTHTQVGAIAAADDDDLHPSVVSMICMQVWLVCCACKCG